VTPPTAEVDTGGDRRSHELAEALVALRERIGAAAVAAGRDPAEVTLIAVTKTYPAADVVRLARLGVGDIGENRDQEAAGKAAEVAAADAEVRWHFVGRLQRNKCRSVVRYADLVHTVDSVRLAQALASAAALRERPLEVLVQVSVDGDPARGGVPEPELAPVVAAVAEAPQLRLRGVMTVAPMSWRPVDAFGRLADIASRLRAEHPAATIVSAGMSGDLEAALACGATHLRIGSALLGKRDNLR
jgi:pyridoxal phosphate enzyme (YggS family)